MPKIDRWGDKVYISSLWRALSSSGHIGTIGLEQFKKMLVTANRDGVIDLARADVQAEMDQVLLRESEIRDHGATFHFVIDRSRRNPW
jgi:hypothetical protein